MKPEHAEKRSDEVITALQGREAPIGQSRRAAIGFTMQVASLALILGLPAMFATAVACQTGTHARTHAAWVGYAQLLLTVSAGAGLWMYARSVQCRLHAADRDRRVGLTLAMAGSALLAAITVVVATGVVLDLIAPIGPLDLCD